MLFLVRLFLNLHITISFSNVICKQSFFSLYGFDYNYLYKRSGDYDYDHCCYMPYMSIAIKTMTKFLKKFKKTIFVAFSR